MKVEQVKDYPKSLPKRNDIVADSSGKKEGWLCALLSLGIDGNFGAASILWSNDFLIP